MSRVTAASRFGRVAVVYGGESVEREISLQSGHAVITAMRELDIDVSALEGIPALVKALAARKIDRIFNILHGGDGENGVVQGLAVAYDVPITGASVLGCALSMDKLRCKAVWQATDLPVASHRVVTADLSDADLLHDPGLPMVVKPVHEGSSVGVHIVKTEASLAQALSAAREFDSDIMAEVFVPGAEYTAAMVAGEILPLIRVETPHSFYDYSAKYQSDSTCYHCPCGLDAARERALQSVSSRAFAAVGIAGWGRLDFILDAQGEPVLLEINTAPGMTAHSLVPMAAAARGWDFKRLVWEILSTTVADAGRVDG